MSHPFDIPIEQIKQTRNQKWRSAAPGTLAAGIAEMDVYAAPAMQAAIEQVAARHDYGYPIRNDDPTPMLTLSKCLAAYWQQRFDWTIDPAMVQVTGTLEQAILACLLSYTNEGDGVVLITPCYPPYYQAIATIRRVLVESRLRDTGESYQLDGEQLARCITPTTRMLILCHPHNPTGRVFTHQELRAIADVAERHDLTIVSDEIMADLVYPGTVHMPMAMLDEATARRTVTLTSASKSYNIPGLRCGFIHYGSAKLQSQMHQLLPHGLFGEPNSFVVDAIQAAWTQGQPWLDEVMTHLLKMRNVVISTLGTIPGLRVYAPDATYLAWLDLRALDLGMPAGQFFIEHCGVTPLAGELFGTGCEGFVRLNFATSEPMLREILHRIQVGVQKR